MSDKTPSSVEGITLRDLQDQSHEWRQRNFPDTANEPHLQLMGVVEEVGELSHSELKMRQGIRGTQEEHLAAAQDAVGDIIVYLSGYCSARGFSLQGCIERAWGEVKDRNWVDNPDTGVVEEDDAEDPLPEARGSRTDTWYLTPDEYSSLLYSAPETPLAQAYRQATRVVGPDGTVMKDWTPTQSSAVQDSKAKWY